MWTRTLLNGRPSGVSWCGESSTPAPLNQAVSKLVSVAPKEWMGRVLPWQSASSSRCSRTYQRSEPTTMNRREGQPLPLLLDVLEQPAQHRRDEFRVVDLLAGEDLRQPRRRAHRLPRAEDELAAGAVGADHVRLEDAEREAGDLAVIPHPIASS